MESLCIKAEGIYVDCTAGGGGHSKAIADRLTTGRLIAIDRDPDAIAVLTKKFELYKNVTVVHSNYSEIKNVLKELNIDKVDGILADLGVSSYQLDEAERGFSFHNDAPLDMRMSKEGVSAADLVNEMSQKDLARIISLYGEDKFSYQIAKKICDYRTEKRIETTMELAEIIKEAYPPSVRRKSGHPARKTFQALRIEVNGEIEKLGTSINDMFDCLKSGGVLSVISFHSGEDTVIKKKFNSFCEGCTCPPEFPVCVCGKKPAGKLNFKFKEPTLEELEANPRSRSAKLRSIIKI